ncbi:hypothetical protein [Streptomyces sp. MA15]|uniref:hypothetical protein n=1 Tax=Streptomyces sp. MA15 TaxID=3055061 RepID=UPI0025B1D2B2|nr:hypothetical protein [Streptomyces sp. MA15]MDN3272276.1 hypothetical protein [Streptomyces sp. MA15]
MTSQTRATDLLWTFDGVRRLADAQIARYARRGRREVDENIHVGPGPLWWAFAPESAAEAVDRARSDGIRPPSTAEYPDALWACRALKTDVGGDDGRWDEPRHPTLVRPQHMRG